MVTQYFCQNERRRELVREARNAGGNPFLNGIDFIEVSPADQRTLILHLLQAAPGQPGGVPANPALSRANFAIDGGVRVTGINVVDPVAAAGNTVTLKVDAAGDFSTYTLRLVTSSAISSPPPGFDPLLSEVQFSFKVNCESDFDCRVDPGCLDLKTADPYINYLAKDYSSFRRLILDRLSTIVPDWRERNPADLGIAIVELLAYTGDYLSYYQDSVATEAYLNTARRRTSVRRHARLVNYHLHEGASARAWLVFETNADRGSQLTPAVPVSTKVLATSNVKAEVLRRDPDVVMFETMHPLIELRVSRNAMFFYTWGDGRCCLPKGATRATLDGGSALFGLRKGDVLVFEEVLGAESGLPEDADRAHRHAVRLTSDGEERKDLLNNKTVLDIQWAEADALPFPLCLNEFDDGAGGIKRAAVARGNVALADHGQTFVSSTPGVDLIPSEAPSGKPYRPVLKQTGLSYAVPFDATQTDISAASALRIDARAARPSITLRSAGETWRPQGDLLATDRFNPEFVVEMESDRRAHIRFGDGKQGRKPATAQSFIATYRIGGGTSGNVGAEALTQLAPEIKGVKVRNPLAATGGADPESLKEAKLLAPDSFRRQERAVTEADYVEVTQRHADVQRAAATRRWTGSWYTMFVTVDRRGGALVDDAFKDDVKAFLERFRMTGYDLEIDAPRFVPLDILFTVCVRPGYLRSKIKQSLLEAFSNRTLRDGTHGFFHPDQFTFGQPVYLSQLIARAMQVTGVESIDVDDTPPRLNRFQRYGQVAQGEIANGFIPIHRLEIARLDNDPSKPENGRIDFAMKGGA